MGVMICLSQGGLRSLSALSSPICILEAIYTGRNPNEIALDINAESYLGNVYSLGI